MQRTSDKNSVLAILRIARDGAAAQGDHAEALRYNARIIALKHMTAKQFQQFQQIQGNTDVQQS